MNLVKENDIQSAQSLWVDLTDVDSELVSGGSKHSSGKYPPVNINIDVNIYLIYANNSFILIGDNNINNGKRFS